MIKVVFVITGLSVGGAEIMLLKLLERIDRSKFLLHVISLTDEGEIGKRIRLNGISLDVLKMRPQTVFRDFLRLVCLLRSLRPDIVQTWMYHSDFLGGLAARLAGVSNIAWALRNSDLSVGRSKRSTRLVMRACAFISRWVPRLILSCSSQASLVHISEGYCRNKMVVIPNGFDLNCFVPNPSARNSVIQELGILPGAKLIGLIARDDPQKNHLGFIDAAKIIRQQLPSSHFLLVGSGIDKNNKELKEKIDQCCLSNYFHLLGLRQDIPRLMSSLDLLVSASHGEAFPNVLGEAMACEIPCVVTNVGDSAEIVGESGRVVEAGDMIGLAEQVINLLSLPDTQKKLLGKAARQRVSNFFEIEDVVRRYENCYIQLFNKV